MIPEATPTDDTSGEILAAAKEHAATLSDRELLEETHALLSTIVGQISGVYAQAGPLLASLEKSPIFKLLGGGKG